MYSIMTGTVRYDGYIVQQTPRRPRLWFDILDIVRSTNCYEWMNEWMNENILHDSKRIQQYVA